MSQALCLPHFKFWWNTSFVRWWPSDERHFLHMIIANEWSEHDYNHDTNVLIHTILLTKHYLSYDYIVCIRCKHCFHMSYMLNKDTIMTKIKKVDWLIQLYGTSCCSRRWWPDCLYGLMFFC